MLLQNISIIIKQCHHITSAGSETGHRQSLLLFGHTNVSKCRRTCFLSRLTRFLALQSPVTGKQLQVHQAGWGGGTVPRAERRLRLVALPKEGLARSAQVFDFSFCLTLRGIFFLLFHLNTEMPRTILTTLSKSVITARDVFGAFLSSAQAIISKASVEEK